jgi:hypothetical protein
MGAENVVNFFDRKLQMPSTLKSRNRRETAETRRIEHALRKAFPNASVEAYRYNSVSIRVRILESVYKDKNRVEREAMVLPVIRALPQKIQDDITILLLLTPAEHRKRTSMLDLEFDDPMPSKL